MHQYSSISKHFFASSLTTFETLRVINVSCSKKQKKQQHYYRNGFMCNYSKTTKGRCTVACKFYPIVLSRLCSVEAIKYYQSLQTNFKHY